MPVYLIQAGDELGPIKIGFTASAPEKRLHQIQNNHWQFLRIVRLFDGTYQTERWLQKRFADRCIQRDWFLFCPEMLTVEPPAPVVQVPATPPPLTLTPGRLMWAPALDRLLSPQSLAALAEHPECDTPDMRHALLRGQRDKERNAACKAGWAKRRARKAAAAAAGLAAL